MVLGEIASLGSLTIVRRRAVAAVVLLAAVVASVLVVHDQAGAGIDRCSRFAADSATRASEVSGTGDRVVVIGDSWSAGLGLSDPSGSWPARLPGRVHVAGFSGSGFGAHASDCGAVSFADRAPAAVAAGADLVVVEGGLNDYDQPDADIRAGFTRLMRELAAAHVHHVAVVGPATAPSRAAAVPHVDALLAALCAKRGVPYVRTTGLRLPYLSDDLHLTPAGHQEFGDYVARQLGDLGL